MPYLSIQTNRRLTDNQSQELLQKASRTVASMLGKPENYVMIAIHDANPMIFAGSTEPAAYLQLKSLGLPETSTTEFSSALCNLIGTELGIAAERIYIEFSGPERHMWGWNNKTF
jgi:phenylpyruvate tautomerase PptA (4-oxalocrotonate tautomerase family)